MNTNQDTTLTNHYFESWFEEWRLSTWKPLPSDVRKECPKHWAMNAKYYMDIAYQAATKASKQRIQELTASNNQLREALESFEIHDDVGLQDLWITHKYPAEIDDSLNSIPAQSLAEHDNGVIERIATALESAEGEFKTLPEYVSLVRALKVTP